MTDELIERLKAAEEGSRELNRIIAKAIGWHRVEPRHTRSKYGAWIAPEDFIGTMSDGSPILDSLHGTEMHREPPEFTTSLDAALSLVPEGDYDQHWNKSTRGGDEYPLWQVRIALETVEEDPDETGPVALGEASTPALAFCIAALTARERAND